MMVAMYELNMNRVQFYNNSSFGGSPDDLHFYILSAPKTPYLVNESMRRSATHLSMDSNILRIWSSGKV